MNEYVEYVAKSVDDAITEACAALSVTSDRLDYEVVSEGSNGFLGMGIKPAVIKARVKDDSSAVSEKVEESVTTDDTNNTMIENEAVSQTSEESEENKEKTHIDAELVQKASKDFLVEVFRAMEMPVEIKTSFDTENLILNIDLSGNDMGVLIGKRGQTLDSLQYLVSLVVNRDVEDYIHVKVDTENYRQRRKATLENLAKNISYKVRKSRTSVSLEPMNPYERRIIHSALQNDRYVTTHSEGDEPYRHVVVTIKK